MGDRPHAFPFSPPLTQNRYDHNMYSPFKCWDISTTYKPRFEDIPFDKENMSRFFFKDPLWFQLVVFFSFGATHRFAALPQKEMVPCTINLLGQAKLKLHQRIFTHPNKGSNLCNRNPMGGEHLNANIRIKSDMDTYIYTYTVYIYINSDTPRIRSRIRKRHH